MPIRTDNYFRYFPISKELRIWGVGVTASGFARTPPGGDYPPDKHPEDHHFDWTHGRTLDALQILLISSGGGWFETGATGECRLEAGMAFLLLPKTWHRYRPDPVTGWEESWVELRGPLVEKLLQAGIFLPETILRRGAIDAGMEDSFEKIHQLVRNGSAGFQPGLSAAALNLLAQFVSIAPARPQPSRIQRAVNEAERYLGEHHAEPLNIEALAKRLGVAYSHFRRAFRAQTGFAPWQYVIHLRLTRARRLLASSDAKLEEVAARVGFSSGFHLSLAFKQAYGQSPSQWRRLNPKK